MSSKLMQNTRMVNKGSLEDIKLQNHTPETIGSGEDFSFLVQEWSKLQERLNQLPASDSVNAIKAWSRLIRASLDTEVIKN